MDGGEKKEVRRPMNAFLIFCKRHRGFVREKNPDMDNRSVTRVLGDLWANLGEEKKIYTNLAKQYKDAFMKANPNYKWHSADKSQCSNKIISKPTNSRVIKNVAEIHTDGSIVPGKLADPDKMGGLNLLLMADKETCDSRSLPTSAAVFSLSRTTAASLSPMPVQTNVSTSEQQPSVSNSALLQLAEMCASELRGSSNDKPIPQRLAPLTLSIPPSSLPLLDSPKASHHAMPPPKKRARHWSLTESDNSFETTNDNISRECTLGSMFLQNASLQKMRCTSVGSAACAEDKFPLERYTQLPSRRKLSSSATESIPSPTGPFTDDVDSPVFSPGMSFSGELKSENHECIDQTPRNISQWSEKFEKKCVSVTSVTVHPSPLDTEKQRQKLVKPKKQPQVARSGMWADRKEQSMPNEVQHTARHGILLPLHAVPSLGTYENRELDGRTDKADFYTWREPGGSKSKALDTSPGSLSPRPISISAGDPSPLPLLRLNHDGNLLENKNKQQHTVARFGAAGNAKTTSSGLPAEFRSVSNLFSVVNEETSFSAFSDKSVTSVINNLESPTAKLPLKFSHNTSDSLSTIADIHGSNEFPGSSHETHTYNKIVEQASPAHTIMAKDGTQNSMLILKDSNPKINKHGNLFTTVMPSTSQTQTFSEGKLKKKWAERMLIESQLNADNTHQPFEAAKDPLNNTNFSQLNTDANQNISPVESKFESSKVMNLIERPAVTTDSQISNEGRFCPSSTLNILNQSLCSVEGTLKHLRSPKPQSSSIYSKLSLLSPQQPLKPSQSKSPTCSGDAKIKLEPDPDGLLVGQKLFHHLHDSNLSYKKEVPGTESKDAHCNQDLNQITAYGKQFMDHVVEQFFKRDFVGDKRQIEADVSNHLFQKGDFSKKGLVTEIKSEPGYEFDMKLKEESTQSVKTCEKKECSLIPAVSSKEKVHGSTSQTESVSSCRKPDLEESRARITVSDDGNPAPLPNPAPTCSMDESVKKLDICKRAATSPSSDPCFQNQWLTVLPESCEQSDLNEDGGAQPLRKSRRPNRGQKYQELIKEGFIQPSRERLAARNADRHGRSFGTREEFEKMEMKRTLKRSVSERDTPSESQTVSCNNSSMDASAEKRFTSGDFDLEKEIESLPVCSLDQLDKKKMFRRRCDSDTLGSPPCLRSSGDTSNNSTRTPSQAKPSPQIGSALDLCETGCPAPHIPLPKEDRPTEPITGSRKRKARKHCITRISVLEDKTSKTEISVTQMRVQSEPSTFPQKKLCCFPGDIQRNSECDKRSSDSLKPVPIVEMTSHVKLDCGTIVGESRDFNNFSSGKVANVATDGYISDKFSISTLKTASAVKNGLTPSSQILSSLSTVPQMKAASPLLSSNKVSESQPAFTAHKRKRESLLSPLPTIQHSTASTIAPKPAPTAIILKASISKIPIKCDPILFKVDNNNTHNLVNKINTQQLHKQLVTLTASKTKMPPLRVLPSEDLHKLKCLERKPKKTVAGRIPEASEQNIHLPRSHYPVKKKTIETNFPPVLSKSSNTPLVSALLGHSDLSSVIKLAERGDRRLMSLKSSSSERSRNTRSPNAIRVDFSSPVLSALNTQFIPFDVGQAHGKTLLSESTSQEIASRPALPSSNRASFSTSTTETSPASLESSPLSDRLPFFSATSKSSTSHAFKPHPSTLLPTAPTSSFVTETINTKQHQISTTAPQQLSIQHVSLVTQPCSSNTPDSYTSKSYTSLPNTGAILHNSLINHFPAAISSSSSAICTNNAAFVSSASSLLTLIPPHSSSSSSAVLPPTVISLAASVPSSKTDIVSYTVIGSSSVIDAGSPHMIGSPHLPESPSVAIVKS